jgi:hypothetical protein
MRSDELDRRAMLGPIDGGLAMMGTMTFRPVRSTRVDTDDALAVLHREQYSSLVRLANLLLDDQGHSEEIVQDAFVKLQPRWGGLRRLDRALRQLPTPPAVARSWCPSPPRSASPHQRPPAREPWSSPTTPASPTAP